MRVNEKLQLLRLEMKKKGLDAYIIPSFDPHQSEYVADCFKARAWISDFTGSAGTVVVTNDKSGLWTDGRYYIQAEKQLVGSEIILFKMGEANVPTFTKWLQDTLPMGAVVGFNNKVFSASQVNELEKALKEKEINISGEFDLISGIWENRPNMPSEKVYIHDVKYAGKSIEEKLQLVRKEMDKEGAEYYLISSLENIAWLYNIRGNDVSNYPVVISYGLVSKEKAWFFIDLNKVTKDTSDILKHSGVEMMPYEAIEAVIRELEEGKSVFFDSTSINNWLCSLIPQGCKKINGQDIATKLKAIKNEVEIENLKKCHIKDGVALVKFLYWLEKNIGVEKITEISAADKLEDFRRQQESFIGPSFDTIAGYKEHAAMMHYKATEEIQYELKKEGMFLVDSGGQFLDGTTDTTRTIILGNISKEERMDFTLVLKGHIALCKAKFLYGCTGTNLDVLARQPLWEKGIDYKCGTGHGVGFLLSVHEGPQRFSIQYNDAKLEKGMIITNEPGIYKEGRHGIRIENTLLVVEAENTEFGKFMSFDVISYCPIDLQGVEATMLTSEEKNWLNNYHKRVYDALSPYLSEKEKEWLRRETKEI